MQIEENIPLAPFTTLKIGGPARFFATVKTEDELLEGIAFARARSLPFFVLGGGSNLVVPDDGYAGVILHLTLGCALTIMRLAGCRMADADAGVAWDALVRCLCEQGISGMECLAGIPGLVGASPIQNIGAYGQEVASTIHAVRALDLATMQFVELTHAECRFAYRSSIFNSTERDRYIITRVDFRLDDSLTPNLSYADLAPLRGTNPSPLDVYHAVRAIRDRKGMLLHPEDPSLQTADTRSAGSFFKNPVVPTETLAYIARTLAINGAAIPHWPAADGLVKLSAAWLIERAGYSRGFRMGDVGISSCHTLALINQTGSASCEQLFTLRDKVRLTLATNFHVTLEQEPIVMEAHHL